MNPFESILNIGKSIITSGKRAVTDLYSGQGAFAPDTNLGIARNTITGLPSAAGTVKSTISDFIAPKRGFDLMSTQDYVRGLVNAKTLADRTALNEKWKAQQPTFKESATTPFRYGAEIASGLGNLIGPAIANRPLVGEGSIAAKFGVPTKTGSELANTPFGSRLADYGATVEDYAIPKTAGEAQAMQVADILSFIPMGSVKAVTKAKPFADFIVKDQNIFREMARVISEKGVIPDNVLTYARSRFKKYGYKVPENNKAFVDVVKNAVESANAKAEEVATQKMFTQLDQQVGQQFKTPQEMKLLEEAKLKKELYSIKDDANAIVKDGKDAVKQGRDPIGRFDFKPKPALSEELMGKINKGKGTQEAFGAIGGVEQDEDGKIKFDPMKAAFGVAGMTAYNKGKGFLKKGVVPGNPTKTLAQTEAKLGVKKFAQSFDVFDSNRKLLGKVDAKDFFYAEDKAKELFKGEYSFLKKASDKPVRKTVNRAEYDAGYFDRKPVTLPQQLEEKVIANQIQKEAIQANPLNDLIKYVAKTGENKGRLPEVLGGAGTKGFGKKGDDIINATLGDNVDSGAVRDQLETFMARKKAVLAEEVAIKNEIKQLKTKPIESPKVEAPRPSSQVPALKATTGEVRSLERMAEQSATKEILDPQLRKYASLPKIIEKTATNVKNKVNALDYLRTPENVLKKIGLESNAVEMRRAYDGYVKELPKNIDKITEWSKRVSKESGSKIFKYLDGEAVDLAPEEVKVAGGIKDWLSEWADRLGLPKDNRIANYITHLFDDQLIKKEFDEDLAKIIADKVPGSVYDPFLQKRLGAKGYKQDAWGALDAYVKRATRKVHMDPALANLEEASRGLEKSQWDYVKKYADRVNMRPTDLDNLVDNGIKSFIGYRLGQRPIATITGALRRATYRGMLGLNVGSALHNLSQGANTYAKLGEKYTTIGYAKLFNRANLAELKAEGVLSSSFVQDRAMSSAKKFMEKADKVLFSMFDTAEKINRGAAYFGAKAKGLASGMNEAQAIEYGKKIVRETQFAFGSIDTPVGMSSDLVKTLVQFQTFTTKQIEFLAGMAKNKEYAGLIRYALSGLAFVYTVGQAFGMKKEDLLPIYRLGIPPSLKLPWEGAKAIVNAPDKYGQPRTTGEKVSDIVGTLPGYIPAGIQGKKTIQGVTAIQQGGSYDKAGRLQFEQGQSPAQKTQAILFGKYASQKAKDYFARSDIQDKKEKSLQPVYDRVQELKQSGNVAEAQKIIDSLSDSDYEIYKQVKSSNQSKLKSELKQTIFPIYSEVQRLKQSGDTTKAQEIIDSLSDDEYDAYKAIKTEGTKQQAKKTYSQNVVSRYAEAVIKDPANALRALFTKEKLGNVEGNLVELQRFYGIPFDDVGGSQEYKKKRMTEMGLDWDTQKDKYKLEHIVPVSAGGSNADSNLIPVDNTEHNLYTPVDIALGNAVKNGKITRQRASELSRGLKVTKTLSVEDIINLLE
jgi:hypothetical protein